MIPTAEQFLIEFYTPIYHAHPDSFKSKVPLETYLRLYINGRINGVEDNLPELLVKFARIHSKAALKAASENCTYDIYDGVDKETILNAYPPENIK